MWLDCGRYGRVELSRITPTAVVARRRAEIPPCHAELVVVVDGEELRNRVNVAYGFTRRSRSAMVLSLDEHAPF